MLFGGYGVSIAGETGYLNDMWSVELPPGNGTAQFILRVHANRQPARAPRKTSRQPHTGVSQQHY